MNHTAIPEQISLLNRPEWLRSLNFVEDPFPYGSFQAETDPIFSKFGLVAFVDPPDYQQLRGTLKAPGPPYIFSVSGGGKSSLRLRIRHDWDESLRLPRPGPRVLAVEYVDHGYALDQADVRSHITRIAGLVKEKAKKFSINVDFNMPEGETPLGLLKGITQSCNKVNIDGICVLVDAIGEHSEQDMTKAFQKIQALATYTRFFSLNNVIFKFMLPLSVQEFPECQPFFSRSLPYEIKWDSLSLSAVLQQRLTACAAQEIRDAQVVSLAQLCISQLADIIEGAFVRFGLRTKTPRTMWQLGHFLLSEHFALSTNNYRRTSQDLINRATFIRAHNRIIPQVYGRSEEKVQGIPEYLYNELRDFLLDCGPFDSDRELRAIFVDSRIKIWQNSLPESSSPEKRVEALIGFLHNRSDSSGKNALIAFLCVLGERAKPEDQCHHHLLALANKLTSELEQRSDSPLTAPAPLVAPPVCPPLRYLHISDLHLTYEEAEGDNWVVSQLEQDLVTRSMLDKLVQLVNEGTNFDFVIISGDLVKRGKSEEYQLAEVFCRRLLEAVKLSPQELFLVPGNHDVDRDRVPKRHLKWWYNFENQNDIMETLSSKDAFPVIMRKFEAFNAFSQKVLNRPAYTLDTYYMTEPFSVSRRDCLFNINIIGLNSALFAGYNGDDKQRLALGLPQVDSALSKLDENAHFSIVFFHHPFECLHPTDNVCKNRLFQKADLILHGHLHHPDSLLVHGLAGQAIIIGAGASYETRESENSFNIVEIDPLTGKGEVQFYKYLPEYHIWKKNTDANPHHTEGKFEFVIDRIREKTQTVL